MLYFEHQVASARYVGSKGILDFTCAPFLGNINSNMSASVRSQPHARDTSGLLDDVDRRLRREKLRGIGAFRHGSELSREISNISSVNTRHNCRKDMKLDCKET